MLYCCCVGYSAEMCIRTCIVCAIMHSNEGLKGQLLMVYLLEGLADASEF